jgi:hypothetical protein
MLNLSCPFDMKDLGAGNFVLVLKIQRDHVNRKLSLTQRKYMETIL